MRRDGTNATARLRLGPVKYEKNRSKHHIKFEQAIGAFADANGILYRTNFDDGEIRHVWIGMVSGRVLYIAYTECDDGDITRIISARKAEKSEVDAYFKR